MRITANDVVMTPDLRFTMKSTGPLDLRLRVARNGDTCVENRGAAAPVLNVADQFGEASYEVKPGQHVLFEHGSLKEVVDNESEPCGCPVTPVTSVADAGVPGAAAAAPGSTVAAKAAVAEQHPFPAAQSAGLAPVSGPPQAPAGVVHAQVSTTLSYGETAGTTGGSNGAGSDANGSVGSPQSAGASQRVAENAGNDKPVPAATTDAAVAGRAEAPPPPPAPSSGNVFHAIGHFFKRMFGGR
jgi:hypothetical protein